MLHKTLWINPKQAGAILGLEDWAVRRACASGDIKARRINNRWFILRSDIEGAENAS